MGRIGGLWLLETVFLMRFALTGKQWYAAANYGFIALAMLVERRSVCQHLH
jgi:hypothetical protein